MLKHLVIGVDLPFEEEAFVHELKALKPLIGLEKITLAYVTLNQHDRPKATEELEKHARVIKSKLELKAADVQVLVGLPAEEINRLTKRLVADAIAVLFHHHSKAHEFFLGSVALDMARSTRHPLFLLTEQPDETSSTLLLASDGSKSAKAAEKYFARLKPSAQKGVIINVQTDKDEDEHQQAIQALQTHYAQDPEVEIIGKPGDPVKEILESCKQHHADLIILGKRGQNPMKDLMFGSTVEQVCRHITRPVLIIPPEL